MTSTLAEDELAEIRGHVDRFFDRRVDAVADRSVVDRPLHEEMGDLGFYSQGLPDALGGLDLPPAAAAAIAAGAGRALVHGPWLDQLVVVELLAAVASEHLPPLLDGRVLCSVAFAGAELVHDPATGTLRGTVSRVRFGGHVDRWCLVTGTGTHVVAATAAGIAEMVEEPAIDPSWTSYTVTFDGVVPEFSVAHGPELHDRMHNRAKGLLACFSVGAAQRVLEIAVEYVKTRKQFGKPVGSFQAIKHRLAGCYIELVHARALAARAVEHDDRTVAAAARVLADEAFRHTAEGALQVHGGVGFTAEVPVHHYVKAAQQARAWPLPISDELDLLRSALEMDILLPEPS
ncbi:MAG: hypothetical protein ABS81_05175 [Pseudonocardia sp. SCN 72-86]|nr:MAG: hypothetical protein ABS81_05175 [Pseudonocardia sp. SCN 72-86]